MPDIQIEPNTFDGCKRIENISAAVFNLNDFSAYIKLFFAKAFIKTEKQYSEECKNDYEKYITRQKKNIIFSFIDCNDIVGLNSVVKRSFINVKNIDEFIEYANTGNKHESLSFLLNYKNNSYSVSEIEKEVDRKINRDLNYNPNSITELKKIWSFKNQDDGNLIITSYKGKESEITVPKEIGENIVTAIGNRAFSPLGKHIKNEKERQDKIASVVIPNSVLYIGEYAFSFCSNLSKVTIPDSVTQINDRAFSNCPNLTILAPADSYAIEYAKESNLKYIEE